MVSGQAQLTVIRGGLLDQVRRRDLMALRHPEIDWLGRIGDAHSAYVHLPRGGYQAGGETLEELLDKLDEFFTADPDG